MNVATPRDRLPLAALISIAIHIAVLTLTPAIPAARSLTRIGQSAADLDAGPHDGLSIPLTAHLVAFPRPADTIDSPARPLPVEAFKRRPPQFSREVLTTATRSSSTSALPPAPPESSPAAPGGASASIPASATPSGSALATASGSSASGDPSSVPPRLAPDYLDHPPPEYPSVSRSLGEQGVALIKAFVDVDGHPAQLVLERTAGSSRLDAAALRAVASWRFLPGRQGHTPVAGWVIVPVRFQLQR